MKLILHDREINLPALPTLEERKVVVDQVLAQYPENFIFNGIINNDCKVKVRLDILGTYLLNVVEGVREDVMSQYKIKVRPRQEKNFSGLNGKERKNTRMAVVSYMDEDYTVGTGKNI